MNFISVDGLFLSMEFRRIALNSGILDNNDIFTPGEFNENNTYDMKITSEEL
jgi:hypothetical protein